MRNLINFGVTLSVIALLFLAFNLVWVLKLPNYRLDLSEKKNPHPVTFDRRPARGT